MISWNFNALNLTFVLTAGTEFWRTFISFSIFHMCPLKTYRKFLDKLLYSESIIQKIHAIQRRAMLFTALLFFFRSDYGSCRYDRNHLICLLYHLRMGISWRESLWISPRHTQIQYDLPHPLFTHCIFWMYPDLKPGLELFRYCKCSDGNSKPDLPVTLKRRGRKRYQGIPIRDQKIFFSKRTPGFIKPESLKIKNALLISALFPAPDTFL